MMANRWRSRAALERLDALLRDMKHDPMAAQAERSLRVLPPDDS